MTKDKQIIDEERMFECVWCKYDFKESDANFILSENPNECVCSGCITEWADNLLYDLKRKEQECEQLRETMHKDICTHYVLGECSQEHHNNCVGRNQCIKDLEQECEELKELVKKQKDVLIHKTILADEYESAYSFENLKVAKLKGCLTEIKEIAEPYQKEIDKICGNCRRYDGCHACCMDTLNNYEYRTGTTKACDKFIELKDFDINKLANQILQKISEVLE